MRAMLLAAGRGERMLPLTEHTPKPLLSVAGAPLIAHHLRKLAEVGVTNLVINVSHLGQQIMDYCGDGSSWNLDIQYSRESQPLETAGGIIGALPLLGSKPFLVVNADIWTDFPFEELLTAEWPAPGGACLVLVDNPMHHPQGDFCLAPDGHVTAPDGNRPTLTYCGIGVYTPAFFDGVSSQKYPLLPLLNRAVENKSLFAQHYRGSWIDVGTPQRLKELNQRLER